MDTHHFAGWFCRRSRSGWHLGWCFCWWWCCTCSTCTAGGYCGGRRCGGELDFKYTYSCTNLLAMEYVKHCHWMRGDMTRKQMYIRIKQNTCARLGGCEGQKSCLYIQSLSYHTTSRPLSHLPPHHLLLRHLLHLLYNPHTPTLYSQSLKKTATVCWSVWFNI